MTQTEVVTLFKSTEPVKFPHLVPGTGPKRHAVTTIDVSCPKCGVLPNPRGIVKDHEASTDFLLVGHCTTCKSLNVTHVNIDEKGVLTKLPY